ncbi:hypothetical protein JCGZ_16011 [Jatropha curcas]|uniref:Uncharacterized protein n=1 Tax=Jatropha curcas TaxID=180498 RepID=A0A067LBX4_JATCU|nr:hypothetical protein JCGZ_16011 [Jatropha curcas]
MSGGSESELLLYDYQIEEALNIVKPEETADQLHNGPICALTLAMVVDVEAEASLATVLVIVYQCGFQSLLEEGDNLRGSKYG